MGKSRPWLRSARSAAPSVSKTVHGRLRRGRRLGRRLGREHRRHWWRGRHRPVEHAARSAPGERHVDGLRHGRCGGPRRPKPWPALSHGAQAGDRHRVFGPPPSPDARRGCGPSLAAVGTQDGHSSQHRTGRAVRHAIRREGVVQGASRPLRTDPVRSTLQPPCRRWKVDDSRPRSSTQLSHLARRTRKGGAHPCAVERRGLEATRASTARFRSAAFGRNRWQNPPPVLG